MCLPCRITRVGTECVCLVDLPEWSLNMCIRCGFIRVWTECVCLVLQKGIQFFCLIDLKEWVAECECLVDLLELEPVLSSADKMSHSRTQNNKGSEGFNQASLDLKSSTEPLLKSTIRIVRPANRDWACQTERCHTLSNKASLQ